MLPAAARLRRREDFATVLRRGARSGRGGLVVHLLAVGRSAGPDEAQAQVGLVVGRSVGNSVVRHRVSRRLRHVMRTRLALLGNGTRLVIRAQPSAAGRSSVLLGEDLDRALTRLGVTS